MLHKPDFGGAPCHRARVGARDVPLMSGLLTFVNDGSARVAQRHDHPQIQRI
jgi:hypothetical protein